MFWLILHKIGLVSLFWLLWSPQSSFLLNVIVTQR
uniref:Uncharacterized protein n=1 Tax=Anguilla anguilla TaxID=7936 RepID=A0A0E9SFU3_ANGAN